jgi:hypothetical protein
VKSHLRVTDEVWIGLALLHREQPHRTSFAPQEVVERVRRERAFLVLRPGVQVHVYEHAVANLPPRSGRYRMLFRMPDATVRLFRPGDESHPERRGKMIPKRNEIPDRYRPLLDWYERDYCKAASPGSAPDLIMEMLGCGKEVWEGVDPDAYVNELRSGWVDVPEERRAQQVEKNPKLPPMSQSR